jgi:hypothetical protein|tara:strand:- start:593 stop:937 length:345 start_codon:yes stop_codon:yes gene_type:complete
MKNNIQKVYSKLPKKKLGLKKHKIDLGLVDDVFDENRRIVEILDEAINQYRDTADLLLRISGMYDQNINRINDAIQKANELGANDIENELITAKDIAEKYKEISADRANKIFSL